MTADDVVNSINVARGSNLFRSRLAHVISCSGADGVVTILLDTPYENLPLMLDVPTSSTPTRTPSISPGVI